MRKGRRSACSRAVVSSAANRTRESFTGATDVRVGSCMPVARPRRSGAAALWSARVFIAMPLACREAADYGVNASQLAADAAHLHNKPLDPPTEKEASHAEANLVR